MVKVTERSVCRGVAGRRSGNVKGVVMHNTWDNLPASHHLTRLENSNNNQLANGFAHYYIDENEIIRVEDTFNGAWHVSNYEGNMYYLGYEVKGNRSTPSSVLKRAEQNAFWQAAIDLRFYKLPVNRNTVRLHHEFSATECPKRSLIEHCGYDSTYAVPTHITNKLKDYYIKEIKKYYDNPKLKPNEELKPLKPLKPKPNAKHWNTAGRIEILKDTPTWNKDFTKKDPNWFFKKGSVIDTSGIVIMPNGNTHARVGQNPNLMITLDKSYVKRF